ncbi:MAG: hypothetical protein KAQ72_10940 [Desulfobacula sp.]|nr:hypothetical protein [Desulfobacula sp.]
MKPGWAGTHKIKRTRLKVPLFYDCNDGIRLRHWVDRNSVKIYNEQNNLQVETTINNPERFKVFRHKQGQDENEAKQRLPMLKGVLGYPMGPMTKVGRNFRGLDPIGKDRELLDSLSNPVYSIG